MSNQDMVMVSRADLRDMLIQFRTIKRLTEELHDSPISFHENMKEGLPHINLSITKLNVLVR